MIHPLRGSEVKPKTQKSTHSIISQASQISHELRVNSISERPMYDPMME